MGILSLFKKRKPILVRCSHCYYEFYLSKREVRILESKNAIDPVCPVKEECHICHVGFMIPVKYTDKTGKQYLFHELKQKIKNLDPNTLIHRISENHNNEIFYI